MSPPPLFASFALAAAFLAAAAPAHAQVFWARSFTANTSTSAGGNFTTLGGETSGGWTGSATRTDSGFLEITAAAPGGGALFTGPNATATLDLSQRTDLHLLVTVRLAPGAPAPALLAGLRSGSGNETLWEIPPASFSSGRFRTFAVPLASAPSSALGSLNLAAADHVLLRATSPAAIQLERLALAEIPARGVTRIVGAAKPGDPCGAAYYATIQAAVNAASPRDLVWVRPGVYHESVALSRDYALPETALRIVADPSGPVILDGQAGVNSSNNLTGLEYAFNWDNNQPAATMIRASHIEIEGFIIRHYVSAAFGNRNPGKITIRHCVAHSNGSAGVAMNFPRPDTRLRVLSSIFFLNGWGEAWAGGIHINNKDMRLNSLAADAQNNPLPNDDDPGHEITGNISFLNLDESEYNSDGNGIMLDYGGGSEARIWDNICFLNAGAGIRNLNGRADIARNILYRNGWDHRAAPGSTLSNNEQTGFLINHDTAVSPGISFDQFLERHYPHFIKSRLANNLVWTASRFNHAGPFFTYLNDEQQRRSLAQFALDYGQWSTFNGQPDSSKWWRAAYGYQLDPALSNGNLFTDDDLGLQNPANSAQTVEPQTRQSNLRETFTPAAHPFTRVPAADYAPPAFAHIYGHPFRDAAGNVVTMSETTQSIGMVWNTSVRKNLSLKLAQVVQNPPPLGLAAFDFTIPDGSPAAFAACRPQIPFAPAYRAVFADYLRSRDGNDPLADIPAATSPAPNPALPAEPAPPDAAWLQAELLYATALHKTTAIPRWRLQGADNGPFGSPFLHAYDLTQLSCLNDTNSLRAVFTLPAAAAPVLRLVVEAPAGMNPNNDSVFVRLKRLPSQDPVALPLQGLYQTPGFFTVTKPALTSAGSGWYRLFFDQTRTGILHLHLPLPELAAGSYELQLQNRQRDVRLDKLGVFLANGAQLLSPLAPAAVTFADWQEATLPPALASQPAHQNPWADASGNGIANILQAFAAVPASSPALAPPDILADGAETGLSFPFNSLLAGFTVQVEESPDLAQWTAIARRASGGSFTPLRGGVQISHQPGAPGRVTVTTPAPPAGRVFYRLRIQPE